LDERGFAKLGLVRDETYAVRLINDSAGDVVVSLSIDGLSVFAFSEGTSSDRFLVPSHGSLTVPGWYRTSALWDSFKVTGYARSDAAESLPPAKDTGTITALFAATWPVGGLPPSGEASAGLGAGAGDSRSVRPNVFSSSSGIVRELGRTRAAVTVRYSTGK
jgi:hypothetical protein